MRLWTMLGLASLVAAAPALAAPTSETLVLKPYPGPAWKRITDKSGDQGWIHEQIPASETEAGFTRILTDQGFPGLGGQDPEAFLNRIFASVGEACDGVSVNGPKRATEGGFDVAYAQVYCGHQHGLSYGVHIFYKVISGSDALYSVSWEDHTPPSGAGALLTFPKGHEAEAATLLKSESAANAYLANDVYLCGGRSTDPRCKR